MSATALPDIEIQEHTLFCSFSYQPLFDPVVRHPRRSISRRSPLLKVFLEVRTRLAVVARHAIGRHNDAGYAAARRRSGPGVPAGLRTRAGPRRVTITDLSVLSCIFVSTVTGVPAVG